MNQDTLTAEYIDGIREGRAILKQNGIQVAQDCIDALNTLCKQFAASSPVGQTYRGERDFWRNQLNRLTSNPPQRQTNPV